MESNCVIKWDDLSKNFLFDTLNNTNDPTLAFEIQPPKRNQNFLSFQANLLFWKNESNYFSFKAELFDKDEINKIKKPIASSLKRTYLIKSFENDNSFRVFLIPSDIKLFNVKDINKFYISIYINIQSQRKRSLPGLLNDSCLCYLNSVLQILYHIPQFRSLIYRIPDTSNDSLNTTITYNLQYLFSSMETISKTHCDTKDKRQLTFDTNDLRKSFGWKKKANIIQNDSHEFYQKLMNKLYYKLLPHNELLAEFQKLFLTEIEKIDKKQNQSTIEFTNSITLPFNKNINTLKLSLDSYFNSDDSIINKLKSLPAIISFFIPRKKIKNSKEVRDNSPFFYPDMIDMTPFFHDPDKKEEFYNLISVNVHSTKRKNPHYYSIIQVDPNESIWYQIDDSNCTEIVGNKPIIEQTQSISSERSDLACMLFYARKGKLNEIFQQIEIPQNLKNILSSSENKKTKPHHPTKTIINAIQPLNPDNILIRYYRSDLFTKLSNNDQLNDFISQFKTIEVPMNDDEKFIPCHIYNAIKDEDKLSNKQFSLRIWKINNQNYLPLNISFQVEQEKINQLNTELEEFRKKKKTENKDDPPLIESNNNLSSMSNSERTFYIEIHDNSPTNVEEKTILTQKQENKDKSDDNNKPHPTTTAFSLDAKKEENIEVYNANSLICIIFIQFFANTNEFKYFDVHTFEKETYFEEKEFQEYINEKLLNGSKNEVSFYSKELINFPPQTTYDEGFSQQMISFNKLQNMPLSELSSTVLYFQVINQDEKEDFNDISLIPEKIFKEYQETNPEETIKPVSFLKLSGSPTSLDNIMKMNENYSKICSIININNLKERFLIRLPIVLYDEDFYKNIISKLFNTSIETTQEIIFFLGDPKTKLPTLNRFTITVNPYFIDKNTDTFYVSILPKQFEENIKYYIAGYSSNGISMEKYQVFQFTKAQTILQIENEFKAGNLKEFSQLDLFQGYKYLKGDFSYTLNKSQKLYQDAIIRFEPLPSSIDPQSKIIIRCFKACYQIPNIIARPIGDPFFVFLDANDNEEVIRNKILEKLHQSQYDKENTTDYNIIIVRGDDHVVCNLPLSIILQEKCYKIFIIDKKLMFDDIPEHDITTELFLYN